MTDKSGKPVRDLTRDEFTLIDNGKPVTITEFEKHDLAAAPTAGVEAPAPEPAAVPEQAVAPALNRKFIILFDFAFNTGHGVKASVEAARRFIDATVVPGDELAFASFSMFDGLKIDEFLTTDHAKVRQLSRPLTPKISPAGPTRSNRLIGWRWRTRVSSRPRNRPSGDCPNWTWLGSTPCNRRGDISVPETVRPVPPSCPRPEEHYLFFNRHPEFASQCEPWRRRDRLGSSPGGPISNQGMGGNAPQRGSTFQVGNYELRPLQESMLREFSASNCSLFSFDTRESSKIPALFEVDQMATASGGIPRFADNSLYRNDNTTRRDSLKKMSQETGGKYYSNIILHEKNLDEVSTVTGTYYVLGYSIPAVADGKFHKIGIVVARKGCEVRTQPGYYNLKPFREYTDIEKNIQPLRPGPER